MIGRARSIRIAAVGVGVGIIYTIAVWLFLSPAVSPWVVIQGIFWNIVIFYSIALVFSLIGYALPFRKERRSSRAEWFAHVAVIFVGGMTTWAVFTE